MTATMNYFPTTVIDNFFVEPHKVVDMTKQDNIVLPLSILKNPLMAYTKGDP